MRRRALEFLLDDAAEAQAALACLDDPAVGDGSDLVDARQVAEAVAADVRRLYGERLVESSCTAPTLKTTTTTTCWPERALAGRGPAALGNHDGARIEEGRGGPAGSGPPAAAGRRRLR